MPDEPTSREEDLAKDSSVWEYGHPPSSFESSHNDMDETRKAMIRFALEQHPIRDIRTYAGYKGDLLVEITTPELDLLPVLKAHAEELGMQVVVKERFDLRIHEVYCIIPDEDIYAIKLPEA
jgi:hypothetical protein